MLYLSRRIGPNRYEVYDTDDGTAEFTTARALRDALGYVDIVGASKYRSMNQRILHANPVQIPGTMTMAQKKLKTLYGIETVVYNGEIASILWHNMNDVEKPVRIKLSSLGNVLGFHCISDNRSVYESPQVVLVFDDSLIVKPGALNLIGHMSDCGVVADVSSVTEPELIQDIYEGLDPWPDGFIDNEERKQRMFKLWRH